jgi:hypothetical protein
MKKAAGLAVAIISLLVLLSLAGRVLANPNPSPGPPSISVDYALDSLNNFVILKIDVTVWQDTNNCTRNAWYSLDSQKNVSIPLTFKGMLSQGSYFQFSEVTGETKMPMWTDGPHTLTVTVVYDYGNFVDAGSATLYIGQPEPTPTPLMFKILSPQDQATYSSNEVPVTYNINSNVSYAYFALDKPDSTTDGWGRFEGNITLTGLSEGSHKLTIFIKPEDTSLSAGYAEKTVYFTVDTGNAQATPTPTVPEFTLLAAITLMLVLFTVAFILKNR